MSTTFSTLAEFNSSMYSLSCTNFYCSKNYGNKQLQIKFEFNKKNTYIGSEVHLHLLKQGIHFTRVIPEIMKNKISS
jgi:hypothetical protein